MTKNNLLDEPAFSKFFHEMLDALERGERVCHSTHGKEFTQEVFESLMDALVDSFNEKQHHIH